MFVRISFNFVFELVARTAVAGSLRVAALDHEVVDHAMKNRAVVKFLAREKDEIVHRFRRLPGKEIAYDFTARGLEGGGVLLLGIDRQGGWRGIFFGHGEEKLEVRRNNFNTFSVFRLAAVRALSLDCISLARPSLPLPIAVPGFLGALETRMEPMGSELSAATEYSRRGSAMAIRVTVHFAGETRATYSNCDIQCIRKRLIMTRCARLRCTFRSSPRQADWLTSASNLVFPNRRF